MVFKKKTDADGNITVYKARLVTKVKEHAVPPCLVLVIDDNLYGLMVALSYI